MKNILVTLIIVSLSSTGCASMFNGSRANVTVRSEDPAAKIYIDEQFVGTGSGTTSISKKGQHSIRVTKEGCGDGSAPITKQFDATSLLGILIDFGIVSMLIIDGAATGAISDIEPRNYTVNPSCTQPSPTKPAEAKPASQAAPKQGA